MHFKNSIQTRYWVSLLVFLIPVVIFGIFIYTYNIDSSKKFILETRLSSFNQAAGQLGYIFDHLKTMATDVSTNQERYLPSNNQGSMDENAIITKLRSMEKNAAIDVEALFYIRGEKYIYSSSQKNLYSYFEQQYNTYDISRSQLFTKLNNELAPTIYQFYFNNKDMHEEGMISFIYPLDLAEGYPAAYVVFLIRENILKEKFSNYLGDSEGDLYVYNDKLDIVIGPHRDKKSPEFVEILKAKGLGQIHLSNPENIALRQIISSSGLTVVTVMPESEFYKQLNSSQRILILLIFLLVLCCLFLSILGFKRTYHPIKNLVKDIVGPNSFDDTTVNEIDLIKNTFNKSKERNQSLMQQLANQNTIIANQFVLRLINGKFKNMEDFNYNATCIGFTYNKNFWFVLHVTFFNKSTWRQTIDQVLEISEELDISDASILFAEQIHQPVICYVIHFGCEEPELIHTCNTISEQFRQFLLMNNVNDFMISVGSPYTDPLMVKQSSFEAGAAVQLVVPKSGEIYLYNNSGNLEHENYMLPAMEKSLLIAGIRQGDQDTALATLESIINYIERTGHSFILARLLCSELLNLLLGLAKENNIVLDLHDLKDLVIFNNTSDFHNSAIAITISLCSQIHAKLDLDSALQKQDILSFIKSNFTREDFSLDFVADSLNLTKSKISTILKEDVGCGFPQFIAILRMDEVKRQLVESMKPIQDIIRDVGYLDAPNFIRKFKMIEGVTPGQFRTLYGNK